MITNNGEKISPKIDLLERISNAALKIENDIKRGDVVKIFVSKCVIDFYFKDTGETELKEDKFSLWLNEKLGKI